MFLLFLFLLFFTVPHLPNYGKKHEIEEEKKGGNKTPKSRKKQEHCGVESYSIVSVSFAEVVVSKESEVT